MMQSSSSDGITTNGTINVSGLESNATWQYSVNSGSSWSSGSGSSFNLSQGTYGNGTIKVKQTDQAGNNSSAASLGAITIVTINICKTILTNAVASTVVRSGWEAFLLLTGSVILLGLVMISMEMLNGYMWIWD